MNTPSLLIRADAGILTGTGHVMRCLAVGQVFQDLGWTVYLAAVSLPDALADRLKLEGVFLHRIAAEIGDAADAVATLGVARDVGATVLMVDGYYFPAEWRLAVRQGAVRQGGPLIVSLDDSGDAPVHGDVVVNARTDAGNLPYDRFAPGALLLLGPAYAALRREIRQAAAGAIPCAARDERVLVTFGGSDPLGLTVACAQGLLAALPDSVMLDVVVGGACADPDTMATAVAGLGARVTVHRNAQDMGRLMAGAGLAVSAAGTTTAELAAIGTPTLLVTIADNQLAAAAQSASLGCCALVDGRQPDAVDEISRAAAALWQDPARRQQMAGLAAALVDGQGAVRIVGAVSRLLDRSDR